MKYGYINYDNFLSAMLTSLQVCTLDNWEIVFNSVSSLLHLLCLFYMFTNILLSLIQFQIFKAKGFANLKMIFGKSPAEKATPFTCLMRETFSGIVSLKFSRPTCKLFYSNFYRTDIFSEFSKNYLEKSPTNLVKSVASTAFDKILQ